MGKVLESKSLSDEAVMAQWIFRKLRNHDPMSERDTKKKCKGHRERERQYQLEPTSNVVRYCMNNGQVFEITVVQVEMAGLQEVIAAE